MRVVVAGGYGVFGSRLAELLRRDGHEVIVAGRDRARAEALAAKLGCDAMAVDIAAAPEALFAAGPDVVVDAVGPFQGYAGDPYRLARLCIANGADYLDFSDDAGFTAGIAALDAEARAAGRRVLSGVSSVPAISSAVAAELCKGLDEVLLIDSAILPGNRAPRGTSVIASIVGQLGTSSQVWRGGRWREQMCWGDARRIALAPDLVRRARFIEVPDIRLFPERFGARSVIFRAGMELGLLDRGMQAIGWLRRRWGFAVTPARAGAIRRLADLTKPFGTDRGGMRVRVVGLKDGAPLRRDWVLVAEAGDGPYVPAVAARAVLRRLDRVPSGARACLAEMSLAEVEEALEGLRVTTQGTEVASPPLFHRVLGEAWDRLAPEARASHEVQDVERFSGEARVTRGRSLPARAIAALFGFPPEADGVPVTVTKTRTDTGETWERNFDGRVFRSYLSQSPLPGHFRERFGPLTFEMGLPVSGEGMLFPVKRGWLLGIPMPRFLLPSSDSREYVEDGRFHFDVALGAPLEIGLIVRYRGWLRPD